MKVLVIRAHPLDESFNAAILAAALSGLHAAGHTTTLIDLEKDDFDPRLRADERRRYHDHQFIPPELARYVELIRSHDAMVFVFPTWCFGVPAILKGFFDRVFRPGVAFHIDGAVVTPLFTHIKKVAGISTYGRARWMAIGMGDPPRKQITKYVSWFCARHCSTEYLAHYHMNASTDATRAAFLAKVEARMKRFQANGLH
jgi:NAD(P)H dehydrogenase (quinone)